MQFNATRCILENRYTADLIEKGKQLETLNMNEIKKIGIITDIYKEYKIKSGVHSEKAKNTFKQWAAVMDHMKVGATNKLMSIRRDYG